MNQRQFSRHQITMLLLLLLSGGAIAGCEDSATNQAPLPVAPMPLPSYTFSQDERGASSGAFDHPEELSRFLQSLGLPAAVSPPLVLEKGSFESFVRALEGTARDKTADDFGLLGIFYLFYERFPEAKSCFEKASELAPDDFKWPHFLGYLSSQNNDMESAIQHFTVALTKTMRSPYTYQHLGKIYEQSGNNEMATKMFRASYELQPVNPYTLGELGYLMLEAGDLKQAQQYLLESLELFPESIRVHGLLGRLYNELGDKPRAQKHMVVAASGTPPTEPVPDPLVADQFRLTNSVQWLKMQSDLHHKAKDWTAMVTVMKELVEREPKPALRARLARALQSAGRRVGAQREARDGLKRYPNDPTLLTVAAEIEYSLKNYTECLKLLDLAIKAAPQHKAPYRIQAVARSVLLQFDQALASIEGLLKVDPYDGDSHRLKGKILATMGGNAIAAVKMKRARELLEEALIHSNRSAKLATPSPELVDQIKYIEKRLSLLERIERK